MVITRVIMDITRAIIKATMANIMDHSIIKVITPGKLRASMEEEEVTPLLYTGETEEIPDQDSALVLAQGCIV